MGYFSIKNSVFHTTAGDAWIRERESWSKMSTKHKILSILLKHVQSVRAISWGAFDLLSNLRVFYFRQKIDEFKI